MELAGAVVLITGGAIRLGRAHGLYLASQGAQIAFTYLPGEPWEKTQADIEQLGVRCTATALDLRDLDAMRAWVVNNMPELFDPVFSAPRGSLALDPLMVRRPGPSACRACLHGLS